MFNCTIHHALHLSRHWLMIFVTPQCPQDVFPLEARGHAPPPRLLQIQMAEFRQEPFLFFLFSSEGHSAGQRSEGVGLVAREESTSEAKPLVLIGLCK